MRRLAPLLCLLLLSCATAMAQGLVGAVSVPEPGLPGAWRLTMPPGTKIQPRDVFEVRRGHQVVGEAMVVQSGPNFCLLPTAHFAGDLRAGDTAVFLRHAETPRDRPSTQAAAPAFRAFANTCRIRLMSPVPGDDLIYDNDRLRVQFDFMPDNSITMKLLNKTDKPMQIEWREVEVTTRQGRPYPVIPMLEYQKAQSLRPPPADIEAHGQLDEQLLPLAGRFHGLTGAQLLPREDDPKAEPRTFTLLLPLHVDAETLELKFVFSAEAIPRRAYLGLVTRSATPDELAHLPPPYSAGMGVAQLTPNGPAWQAGLQLGDIIVEYDGKPAASNVMMNILTNTHRAGDVVKLIVIRRGAAVKLSVVLASVQ